MISHLATANRSAACIERRASAFKRGNFRIDSVSFGTRQQGDMATTVAAPVAAILLDAEARRKTMTRNASKLRETALAFTGVLRALDGNTDGEAFGW